MRIPRKVAAIARGTTAALVIAVGGTIVAPGQPLLLVAIGAVGGTAVAVGARRVVHRDPRYAGVAVHHRDAIARWISASSAAHVAWIALYVTRPDLAGQWIVGLLGLAGLSYVVARSHEYLMAHPPAQKATEKAGAGGRPAETAEPTAEPAGKAVRLLQAALDRTEWNYLDVLGAEEIPHGRRFWIQVPSRYAAIDDEQTKKKGTGRAAFGPLAAEGLAIGLSEVLRAPMRTDWVQISKMPEAGRWKITVVTQDVFATVITYVDDLTITSLRTPIVVGFEMDGTAGHLVVAGHGQIVGMSRFGKTSLANRLIAFALLAATVWIGGVEKLYDLVAGWLLPYEDHPDLDNPFDWIANGQSDVLDMLVAAMTIARTRQRVRLHERTWKPLVIVLDEASFTLSNRTEKALYDGQWYTASELLAMITKGAGSAEVFVWVINQRGTNGQYGDSGGDMKANFAWAAVFRTRDSAELGRTMEGWKLERPRQRGEYWLDPGEGHPVRLKAPYIQEVDPSKAHLHDGPTLADISWARNGLTVPLDARSAAVAGPAYARRHRHADSAMMAYLMGEEPAVDYGEGAPSPTAAPAKPGRDQGRAEARAEMIRLGLLSAEPAAETQAAPTSVPAAPTTRRERVLDIVRDHDGPIETAEIIAALKDRGDVVTNPTVVTNLLGKLVKAGDLARPETGSYTLGRLRIAS